MFIKYIYDIRKLCFEFWFFIIKEKNDISVKFRIFIINEKNLECV